VKDFCVHNNRKYCFIKDSSCTIW